MFALVVGALAFAGLATLGLVYLDSIHKTETELVTEAKQLAEGVQEEVLHANHHDSLAVLRSTLAVLKAPLNLQNEAVYGVRPNFSFYNLLDPRQPVVLPANLKPADLETAELVESLPVTGHRGDLVWAALLFSTQKPVAVGGPQCPGCQDVNLVVVLARQAPTGVGGAGMWFAIAAAATILVSLVVANRLGHRIARPLRQAQEVTGRIAAGDLSARVPVPRKEGHELVSLANSVNKMAASLAAARGAQRQFLMSVSHDLRTPLTSIRGYAEALADGTTDDVGKSASVILSEATRLERLVGDLLELAKLEAGSFSLSCTTVDLGEVVAHTAEAFEPAAASLGLSLELEAPGPSGWRNGARVLCYADPDRLGQVAANVIENALKYARSRVVVTVSGGSGAARPTLTVADDGPGIAPEDLGRVFERLYQSANAASRKLGSGLGLAIVKELVTAMGGEVKAESPTGPSGGARIVVTLRQPEAKGSAAARQPALSAAKAPKQVGGA
jgi:two-component system sensor histidine kinase BaeS